jgi:hypothetical protein
MLGSGNDLPPNYKSHLWHTHKDCASHHQPVKRYYKDL